MLMAPALLDGSLRLAQISTARAPAFASHAASLPACRRSTSPTALRPTLVDVAAFFSRWSLKGADAGRPPELEADRRAVPLPGECHAGAGCALNEAALRCAPRPDRAARGVGATGCGLRTATVWRWHRVERAGGGKRRVGRGEAIFGVPHAPARPRTVTAPSWRAHALHPSARAEADCGGRGDIRGREREKFSESYFL
eukprot:scaffold38203_cov32-Tisochrysis_lutea.AAC.2